MEGHIIKEGFEFLAEKGLAVVRYIADADSHTFSLIKTLPWADNISKVDCSNHSMRNVTNYI